MVELFLVWILLCLGLGDTFGNNLLETLSVASVFAI